MISTFDQVCRYVSNIRSLRAREKRDGKKYIAVHEESVEEFYARKGTVQKVTDEECRQHNIEFSKKSWRELHTPTTRTTELITK